MREDVVSRELMSILHVMMLSLISRMFMVVVMR